jgi:hypothetical protein
VSSDPVMLASTLTDRLIVLSLRTCELSHLFESIEKNEFPSEIREIWYALTSNRLNFQLATNSIHRMRK